MASYLETLSKGKGSSNLASSHDTEKQKIDSKQKKNLENEPQLTFRTNNTTWPA